MEYLILIVLLLSLLIILHKLRDNHQELHARFNRMHQDLESLRTSLLALQKQTPPPTEPIRTATTETPLPVIKPVPGPPAAPKPPVTAPPVVAEEAAIADYATVAFNPGPAGKTVYESLRPISAPLPPPVPAEPPLSFRQRFLQQNPDLEKFIGENLINKIGIAILVLGIGYFVKFAIDKDWINEIGRVFIGILAGGLLIGLAHRLRHTLAAFSSVLVGGGLAVLYFTIAIAFHEYQLFSQTAAFLIMVVITGFSILLSVSYNRVELAVISLIGGFATPFMLSTGEGNYQVLFTYVLILNVGMLVLAYLKGWRIINWVAYLFTILLYGGWLSTRVLGVKEAPYLGALVFATLFYLVFFLMNIINNLKEKARFTAPDIFILLSNTFLFYTAGMLVLAELQGGLYRGLFTVAIAAFNFAFAFALYRNQKADRNLIFLLIGLVVTFISLAIPIQLEGNYITLFWALEAVLLLWLAQKSGLQLVAAGSVVVMSLMLLSLFWDWLVIYLFYSSKAATLPVLLNKGFITSFIAILSMALTLRLLQSQTEPIQASRSFRVSIPRYIRILSLGLTVVVYLALALELSYQLNVYVPSVFSRIIITGTYNLAFITALFLLLRYQRQANYLGLIMLLAMLGITAYITYYSPAVTDLLETHLLLKTPGFAGFYFHYLSALLVLVLLFLIYRHREVVAAFSPKAPNLLLWLLSAAAVYTVSTELLYHVIYFKMPATGIPNLITGKLTADYGQFERLVQQTNKIGFPILWGICAFVLMYIGLQKKNKTFRIIALSLFALTLLKLFIYDIRGISEGGKIAAFISLGVLLLVISFMYQNIKRIILADEAVPPQNE